MLMNDTSGCSNAMEHHHRKGAYQEYFMTGSARIVETRSALKTHAGSFAPLSVLVVTSATAANTAR